MQYKTKGGYMIKRDKRHVGKEVVYLSPHPRAGRTTKVNGFRGDQSASIAYGIIPYVTTSDGNTVAGHLLKRVKKKKVKIKIGDRVTTIHSYRSLWGEVVDIIDTQRPNLKVIRIHRYRAHVKWDGINGREGRTESVFLSSLYKDGEKPIQLRGKELVDPRRI